MALQILFTRACAGIIALLFALGLSDAHAAGPAQQILNNSIRAVIFAPATGKINPHKAFIIRTTLQASETSATMPFDVVLKMRNFAELQARVNNHEHISPQEMAAKYEPLPADYQATVAWLMSKGLTITHQDNHHMAIFASGKVSQVQSAMKVTFARVASEGQEYTSAITAPSVPATISPLLVGINGLQPHIRAHSHLMHPNDANGAAPYSPAQIAQAYQATALYNQGLNGAGQTIAIIIDTFPLKTDLIEFWNAFGINQSIDNIQFIQAVAGTLPAPSGEETLDTEWSSAMASGAKVRVYAATDLSYTNLSAAYQQVYDDASAHPEYGIHQMSMSYGSGEGETSHTQLDSDNQLFAALSALGVTCFASSGDAGPTPALDGSENGMLEPESPASSPNVIAVGGTTLALDTNNNESTEVVWNTPANGTTVGGASGGGTSTYFSRPSVPGHPTWQTGSGVPAGSMRLVPDISCAADPNYGAVTVYEGGETVSGGTSWSSPTCAAFCALMNQARANLNESPIGELGPYLYPLIGTSSFRDIISGNNATPNSGSTNGVLNYTAGVGYDEASGIGAPIMSNLVLSVAQTATLTGLYAQSTLQTVDQGLNVTFSVTASGNPSSYQWQRLPIGTTTWSNLSDNSTYSGTASAYLTVNSTTAAMSGDQFQCVVTYSASPTLISNPPCVLMVETPWTVSTLAGTAGSSGLPNTSFLDYPTGIAIDSLGNLYVSDLDNNAIRKVTSSGVVSTPYGSMTGASGSSTGTGNDGVGNLALFSSPRDITGYTFNGTFYLYVTDEGSNTVRQINTSTRQVTTITTVITPDPTTHANTALLKGIGVDSSGNIYVADSGNNVIRKVAATNGLVAANSVANVFAGSSSFTSGATDGAATAQALFNQPIGLAIDHSGNPNTNGNIYVTDYGNEVVRQITPAGVVSTIAGQAGLAGCLDGAGNPSGPGTQALFNVARGITVDNSGNLYVTDSYTPLITQSAPTFSGNDILRKITPTGTAPNLTWTVITLAGQAGISGTSDGAGSGAQFYNPAGLAMNSSGTLYIADASNNTIRSATPVVIPTVSLTTTQAIASVQPSTTGEFTVTRSGSTAGSISVNYAVSGTAKNSIDYATLTGTVTIPAGAMSATITVTPLVDPKAQSSLTVQLNLTGPAGVVTINPIASSGAVTIVELPSIDFVPLSSWKSNYSSIASLNDGIPLLLKYLCDIDPSVSVSTVEHAALPAPVATTVNGTEYLTLAYRRYLYATGVTVTVQSSPDLINWTTVNPPDLSQQIGVASDGNPIWEVGVKTNGAAELFIRLNVTSP